MTNQNNTAQAADPDFVTAELRGIIDVCEGSPTAVVSVERMRLWLSKLRAPVADERAALQKLVDLEDMRLRLRALHENGHGTDYDHYHKALPAAWESARAALASAPVADERALDLLDTLFTAYENGTPCYEEPNSQGGYLGMAFRMDDDTFRACADLLNKERPRTAAALASTPVADERTAFDAVSGLEPPCASRRGNHFREGYLEARADALRVLGSLASAPVAGEAVYTLSVKGVFHNWKPTTAAFSIPDGEHQLFLRPAAPQVSEAVSQPLIARALDEWHEDDGPVTWWAWCGHEWAGEAPWCGTPLDQGWPGYHTHWTPIPGVPAALSAPQASAEAFDFVAHLARQAEFSVRTFGPGARVAGVCDHIRKELIEVETSGGDLKEWVDVIILGLDGAWRSGATPQEIIAAIVAKQAKNEARTWPDWRTVDPTKAIEHDRGGQP